MSDSIPRTMAVSLLLHAAAVACWLHLADAKRAKPVFVDLSLIEPGGAPAGAGKAAQRGKKGSGGAEVTPFPAASPSPHAPPAQGAASDAAAAKAARAPLPLAPRSEDADRHLRSPSPSQGAPRPAAVEPHPLPVAPPSATPVAHPQAQPAGGTGVPARRENGIRQGGGGATATSSGNAGEGRAPGRGEGDDGRGGNAGELRKRYVADNFAYILRIIQGRMVYPARARREGLAGSARVSFTVLENGAVDGVRLLRSTGYEILDVSLLKTIREAAPFPKPPISAELQMTLSYRLNR